METKRLSDLQSPEYTFVQNEDEIESILDGVRSPSLGRPPYLVVKIGDAEYAEIWGVNSAALDTLAFRYL